jgi:hypothetical protein
LYVHSLALEGSSLLKLPVIISTSMIRPSALARPDVPACLQAMLRHWQAMRYDKYAKMMRNI